MSEARAGSLDGVALRRAGRALQVPFLVALDDGDQLECRQVLRLLPGKRLAVRAEWRGRDVLAKLFFADPGAARHAGRELAGVRALRDAGLRTPELLAEQTFHAGIALLFEFLHPADSLQQAWLRGGDEAGRHAVLAHALPLIARMHDAGLKQDDIHLDNFLVHGEEIHCIDGDGMDVAAAGSSLSPAARCENLGLFFAQLPIAAEALVPDGLGVYLAACAAPKPVLGLAELMAAVAAQRLRRQREYLGKTLRDCTRFEVRSGWWRFLSFERALACGELEMLLADPDRPLLQDALLKRGNTATVGLCDLGGRAYVLKRYNIKNFWHGLRRAVQPSRAWRSWLAGHLLLFMGIPTPRPVLLLEERFGPLRRRAFLLTEAVSGPHALEYFLDESETEAQQQCHARAILQMLSDLVRARISHGDLKATNILIGRDGPVLIDLDAMQQHRSETSFRKAFRGDLVRFMRNWPEGSRARRLFATEVGRLQDRLGRPGS